MFEVENLTKNYKKKLAVDGISLYLDKGESVGLLGPNGAGKSTTISMMSTLISPNSGDVRYNGKNVLLHPDAIRPVLGVIPQEIALYEELSAYENMKFFGKVYGLSGKKLEQKIDEVLDLVGLQDRKKERVKHYSGGMKRRINIAVALLHEPEILIMDEPTVGIDPQSRNYILEMVRTLNREKGMTVLYTSHYMEEVERLCDRIYIMDHGQIIASGTKEELKSILSAEKTVSVEVLKKTAEFLAGLSECTNVKKITERQNEYKLLVKNEETIIEEVLHLAKEAGVKIKGIHVQEPTLEDVFLHLTGRKLRD